MDDSLRMLERAALQGDREALAGLRAAFDRAGLRWWVFLRRETREQARERLLRDERKAQAIRLLAEAKARGASAEELSFHEMCARTTVVRPEELEPLPLPDVKEPAGGRSTWASWTASGKSAFEPYGDASASLAASLFEGDPHSLSKVAAVLALLPPKAGQVWWLPVKSLEEVHDLLDPGEECAVWDSRTGSCLSVTRKHAAWDLNLGHQAHAERLTELSRAIQQAVAASRAASQEGAPDAQ